jgi:hypothetical protein
MYQLDSSFPTFGKVSYITCHEHVALSNIHIKNLYNVWIFPNTELYFWSVFMSVRRILMTCSTFSILVFSLPFIFIDALSYLEHCQISAKLVRPAYMMLLLLLQMPEIATPIYAIYFWIDLAYLWIQLFDLLWYFNHSKWTAKLLSLRELYQASIFVPIYHAFCLKYIHESV